MPCYHTWSRDGQRLPCGKCRGCRAALSREWSLRIMHEASLHEANAFLTLTYRDEAVPAGGSLRKSDFQEFMRRLRKAISPEKVRYYAVGEYGSDYGRPHFHCILFGYAFPDRQMSHMRKGYPVYRSEVLRELWRSGHVEIGSVTAASASYVSGYIRKRITGKWAKCRYGDKEPEFALMSRRPGIGAGWIEKFGAEVYPRDSVIVRGREVKPPRYYDERWLKRDLVLNGQVRQARADGIDWFEQVPSRCRAREAVAIAGEDIHSRGGVL